MLSKSKSYFLLSKSSLYVLVIYGLLTGILFLAVPISVQFVVYTINSSMSVRPIISLILILLLLLSLAFFIKILQQYLIEHVQRNIFVKLMMYINQHLNRIKFELFSKQNITEKINRVFEVTVIQKSIAILFLVVIEVALQVLFCIMTLAFYHPMFLVFDIFLVISITIAILLPFFKAYKEALEESKYKYKIASWLEEQSNNPLLFRNNSYQDYALDKVDEQLCDYLEHRKKHFSNLIQHFILIGLVYIFSNIFLLSLGSYLIINSQLDLSQLVAAEILLSLTLAGLIKFSYYLNDMYGFFVAVFKLNQIFGLEENNAKQISEQTVKGICLDKITKLEIVSNDKKAITNFNDSKFVNKLELDSHLASEVVNIFVDGMANQNTQILINDINILSYNYTSLNKDIFIVKNIEIFEGSFLDNLTIDKDQDTNFIYECLDILDISFIKNIIFEETSFQISRYHKLLTNDVLIKITILRAILYKPKLLILVDILTSLDDISKKSVIDIIESNNICTAILN